MLYNLPELPNDFSNIGNNNKALFSLYYSLIPYLKKHDELSKVAKQKEEKFEECVFANKSPVAFVITNAFVQTAVLAIPFLIAFYIITPKVQLSSGISLFVAWQNWIDTFSFLGVFGILLKPSGILKFFGLLIYLFIRFIILPPASILFPFCIVLSTIQAVRYKKNYSKIEDAYKTAQAEADNLLALFSNHLSFVPVSYRTSEALEFFCSAFINGKVSNVKEAEKEYDLYLYRNEMREKHDELLKTAKEQNETLRKINNKLRWW